MKSFSSTMPGIKGIGLCVLGLAFIFNALYILLGRYTLPIVFGIFVGSLISFAEYSIRYKLLAASQGWIKQKRTAALIVSFSLRLALMARIIMLIFKFEVLHNIATLFFYFLLR